MRGEHCRDGYWLGGVAVNAAAGVPNGSRLVSGVDG